MGRISRRAVVATGTAALAAGRVDAAADVRRPNVLWLVSEDNNPYIGAYGDRLAHTPTLDALAAKGVLYRHAYSTAPVCAPSRFGLITGVYAEACAPANHMRARARLPAGWRTTPEYMRAAGYYCTNNEKTDYNCDADPARIWHASSHEAHWRNRPAGQPFFSVFNYMTTHESQVFRPTPGRVRPDDVKPPPYMPDTPEVRQDFASYYNLMERMDGQLTARLAELEADGLADDTIVFYYSDNGGVLPRSKRSCHDEGVRCALIVYVPAKWSRLSPGKPGTIVETPVSLIDLPPTILALAGAPQPPQMQGQPLFGPRPVKPRSHAFSMRNRMDERYDMVRTVTEGRWRYIRNYMPHLPAGQHMAFEWLAAGYQSFEREHLAGRLTPAQERFFQPRPFEELYDLDADPDELNNLAGAPSGRAALASLRRALDRHMLAINDNGFIPEGSPLEGAENARAPGAYPLAKVMALAALAAARNPANLPVLRDGLADGNEVIRYWSGLGLVMLGPGARPAAADIAARLSAEPSPQVKVALAEALAHARSPEAAAQALAQILAQSPSMPVKLQALNALSRLGPAARPAIAGFEPPAMGEGAEYLKSAAKHLRLTLDAAYTPETPIFDTSVLGRPAAPR